MISAVVNMAFVAAYPVWSLMLITLDVIVIYAIIAHGRELKDSRLTAGDRSSPADDVTAPSSGAR